MGKRVVIIGAVALGPKVAARVKRLDYNAEVTVVDRTASFRTEAAEFRIMWAGMCRKLKDSA